MVRIDSFESVFRAADKQLFTFEPQVYERALILTDQNESDAYTYSEQVKSYLSALNKRHPDLAWDVVTGSEFDSLESLLALVKDRSADLICSYRHLGLADWHSPYTLGDAIEILTQAVAAPIMVLPHPTRRRDAVLQLQNTNAVMALTDHLAGDDRLVNAAAGMVEPNGTLFLSHVEDERTFERYMDVISKLPSIDTDSARHDMKARLLREPKDFIASCADGLSESYPGLQVKTHVSMGGHLETYQSLVREHDVDLLVMNTKDQDQMAMHGLAYPIAVQLRDTPLLML